MKTLIVLLLAMAVCFSGLAQPKFSVPERSVDQKQLGTFFQLTAFVAGGISNAKENGQTAREYGAYLGNLFKLGWNKDEGFDNYVNGMLGNIEDFRWKNLPATEILQQSEDMIQFKWSIAFWENFFGGKEVYGVSLQEFLDVFDAISQEIAGYLGVTHQQELKDGWLFVTIKRK